MYLMLLCGMARAEEVAFKVHNESFRALLDTTQQPILLYDKGIWLEGPQVLPNGNVVFSDVKANKVLLLEVENQIQHSKIRTWLKTSHFQNGHALDTKGRLLAATHGRRAIERLDKTGTTDKWEVLVNSYQNNKLNSPNDILVDSDGDIWFSDPRFGLLNPHEGYGGREEQGGDFLYHYSERTKTLIRLETPLLKAPNGLALSPDEKILYVADSELAYNTNDKSLQHQILAYDIAPNKTLHNARVFAVIHSGFPDGIKVDKKGNIWSSSGNGIQVFDSKGSMIGEILFPQVVSNFAFSLNDETLLALQKQGIQVKQDHQTLLYVTSLSKLYVLTLKVQSGIKRKQTLE